MSHIFDYIVIALAFGLEAVMYMRNSVEQTRISLVRGLASAFLMAAVFVGFMLLGMLVGNFFQFQQPDDGFLDEGIQQINSLIFLGFALVVVFKLLMGIRKNRALPAYDISTTGTMLLFSVATGINVLILGIGMGFLYKVGADVWKVSVPMFLSVLLFAFWGVMLGRNKVVMRHRRWQFIAVLCLLGIAVKGAFL